jgi:hypothetical protein
MKTMAERMEDGQLFLEKVGVDKVEHMVDILAMD